MHRPVMLSESLEYLNIHEDRWYLDCTFGRGGHTKAILQNGGKVVAIDHDAAAIEFGVREFADELAHERILFIRENFSKLSLDVFEEYEFMGALIDAGVSSPQLDDAERGFSFQSPAPLDMRMDTRMVVTAKDLINGLGVRELEQLFITFAQESRARKIAKAIVDRRKIRPIENTDDLADIIERVISRGSSRIHPATKTFMALRIAVNDELGSLELGVKNVFSGLSDQGRLVVISFHEGEDRIVKHQFKKFEAENIGKILTPSPVIPGNEESSDNPRSRSAKLRAIEKHTQSKEEK